METELCTGEVYWDCWTGQTPVGGEARLSQHEAWELLWILMLQRERWLWLELRAGRFPEKICRGLPSLQGGLTTLISTLSPPRRKDPQLKILSEHSQRKSSSHLILITRDLAGREGGTVIMGFCIERTGQASMGAIPRPATRGRVEGSGLKSR